ncbi:MAG: imidazoleglycerol-phosphate dehydratase HisB [Defluviitaleaceae bacterium]|nr:imidazoleglycerol-phosphate dehydratase HisB [Defluviitaleaceae bacterium]
MRETVLERQTSETWIKLELGLDKQSENEINTGVGFFDHMLNLLAFRAGMTLAIKCDGDLYVDAHHTVEDVGIALGQALAQILGDKSNINRYGEASIPMDESLARCMLDISGRPFLVFRLPGERFPCERLGVFETEMVEEFFRAFAFHAGMTMHLSVEYGKNTHHMVEALFKAAGVALRQAVAVTNGGVTSTKGVI